MLDIQIKPMASIVSAPESEAKAFELALSRNPIAAEILKSSVGPSRSGLFSPGMKDPLALIAKLLNKYINDQTIVAKNKAADIDLKSKSIAELSRLFALVMDDRLPSTKPSDTQSVKLNDGNAATYLAQMKDLVIDASTTPATKIDMDSILGTNWQSKNVSYDQLQAINTSMTAYCSKIQAGLDTTQQEFKNTMTLISSAQEELRDTHRSIVSFAQVR
ncbi:hypothetical protein KFE26_21260 [Shewanella sp. M16]|uniref:hypothetical protein n=1 Tax=Shewanella sp. M16 TaxID=2830837 RepID=UPI001BAF1817|nr:hypothetical protein [Shewanella sp. M16]MBS0044799.1 hypothetical protein [Shewanella sp. M16]